MLTATVVGALVGIALASAVLLLAAAFVLYTLVVRRHAVYVVHRPWIKVGS